MDAPTTLVQQVRTAVQRLGWQYAPLCFAGISMGGGVALSYACQYPENVGRLFLLAGAGLSESALHPTTLSGQAADALFCGLAALPLPEAFLAHPLVRRLLGRLHLVRKTPQYGVREDIAKFVARFPMSVAWGGSDFIHSLQLGRWEAGRRPGEHEPLNYLVVPWMEHVLFCLSVDKLQLHMYPDFWHDCGDDSRTVRSSQWGLAPQAQYVLPRPRL